MSRAYVVVVWGDSIAAGAPNQQWPQQAEFTYNVCLNTGRAVKVFNEGAGGMPAAQARQQFAERILAHHPDLVILQFGFNDLRHDGSRGELPLSTPDEFAEHLTELVRRCRDEAHAQVVIFGNHRARVTLRLPTGRWYDETRVLYNQRAEAVAAASGVPYHDLSRELQVPEATWTDLVCDDGVHLSALGCHAYARFAAMVIRDALRDAQPRANG